ncbi:hypothetical protein RvY_01611 [Ramazzottius varieornatus]|uniref:Uncharacterized protein n=1 Tax=Ramazzottius varieornatus TaxID=947166 RepID=A0A1D1UMY9_RAMVA|nr:hypothetical protein RvY_01611 [Ramazzottius varieornatus]
MIWRKFKPSHHTEQCIVDFITLGQAALDERKVTASEWQKFYKEHRDCAKKIVCWDNCKDVDPRTGVKRIRKTYYPEIPDPPVLDE